MFYYLYQIKNNINGKIYVGVHKTKNMDDGYMGSGKNITAAIKKHGIENFTKTILKTFDTQESMFAYESHIVNEDFLLRGDVYNIRTGGNGGWDFVPKNDLSKKIGRKNANLILEQKYGPQWRSVIGKKGSIASSSPESKLKRKLTKIDRKIKSDASAMNTPEVNEKRIKKFAEINHSQGDKNSQFGSMWITDGNKNMKIHKEDNIPFGWQKGRKNTWTQ